MNFFRFNGLTLNYFQLLSLDDGQLGWVAKHLAHTIDTHKTYYRQQESVVELAKVSRLLIAADEGTLHMYQGKTLEDIGLDGELLKFKNPSFQ